MIFTKKETEKIELVARPNPLQTDTTRSIFHHQHIQRKKPYFNVVFRPSNASSHISHFYATKFLYPLLFSPRLFMSLSMCAYSLHAAVSFVICRLNGQIQRQALK